MKKSMDVAELLKYVLEKVAEADEYTVTQEAVDTIQPTQDGIYKMNIITIRTAKRVKS